MILFAQAWTDLRIGGYSNQRSSSDSGLGPTLGRTYPRRVGTRAGRQ